MVLIHPALPAPATTRALGQWGESCVADWCLAQGWTLLARHVTAADSELDLIVQMGDRIAFGEVRVRRTRSAISALESVGVTKRRKIEHGAARWLAEQSPLPADWHFHFDLFLLEPEARGWELTHLEDAWSLEW